MAIRPIFLPLNDANNKFVKIINIEFKWIPGLALSQYQKNILSFHDEVKRNYNYKILEISSKSQDKLGKRLSAFNLCLDLSKLGIKYEKNIVSIESLFQGSKVFRCGGPYIDLYMKNPHEAKADERIKNGGNVMYFDFFGEKWENKPYTLFYNWLYINALYYSDINIDALLKYDGFSDIVFNPEKSINCQAYSCALYVSFYKKRILEDIIFDKNKYIQYFKENLEENFLFHYQSIKNLEKYSDTNSLF